MSTVLFVRHAAHDRVASVLCGRMPGIDLGVQGRDDAAVLATRLRHAGAVAVLSSPMERALQTATIVARALDLPCTVADALTEIDFGDWTGRRFDGLAGDAAWGVWNRSRAGARPPRGESMAEAQARVMALIAGLGKDARGPVILVSHADVIKAAILQILGLSLDAHHRFDIDPASVTTLALWPDGGRVVALNERLRARDPQSKTTSEDEDA